MSDEEPIYRRDLAYIHDQGYGRHADQCAPGILTLLEPVRGGVVLELGCGSGLLTRHLVAAGHRVIATDASPAMLELARAAVPGAEQITALTLPEDPVPPVDAIVGVGHVLNYLPDLDAIHSGLDALADALRPGGVLALDVAELSYGVIRRGDPPKARVEDDWAIITEFHQPSPDRFDRAITTFVRAADDSYRRSDEHHSNVLLDIPSVLERLRRHGVPARAEDNFDDPRRPLPAGLKAIIGRRGTAS
jgi:SAM-dependent methyltransferase